jgi:putative ABC transport system permease protein
MAIRHALRSLRRTPVFTLAVILTLAVGAAAVGSMFAIVHGVLLAPLPYGEPDQLVSVRLASAESGHIRQPPALQVTYDDLAQTLDGVGFYRTGSTNVWTEGSDEGAQSVIATWVTASMMPLLKIPPLLGRSFTAEEALRGGPDAVILSEAEWRDRYNAAPDVLGRTLMVNSVPRQIVGVMPARFAFPLYNDETRLWLPAKRIDNASVGDFSYAGVARLAPGASVEQAQRELAAILPKMAESFPLLDSGSSTATWLADVKPVPIVVPLRDEITAGIARTLWMLAAASGLVLLVAWANVANLMLIRADGRQPELAVRAALGAGRLRNATHFLAEALLLGSAAGLLALLLMIGAVEAFVAFGPGDLPRLAELGVRWPTVAFTLSITVASVLVCAAVPAGPFWRAGPLRSLREGGRGASSGKSRGRLRAAITTLQIAVALVVTIGSALLLRTAHGLSRVDPGFDGEQVTMFRTQLPMARYDEAAAVAFYARLVAQVRNLPSVDSAGVTTRVPLESATVPEQIVRVDGHARTRSLPVAVIDDGYFAAMSIPLLAGRGFRPVESERGSDVVISRRAAATLFGDTGAMASVGKRFRFAPSGLDYTVVGVVGDVRDQDLASAPAPLVYRAHAITIEPAIERTTPRNMALIVKSNGPVDALVPAIRRIVQGLDPTVPIYSIEAMSDVVRASTARLSLVLALMTAAAAITLTLGTIGLYGVMAYLVALRMREFGVRVALGADPKRIARLVASRGMILTACGVAVGFMLYAIAAPLLRAYLFGVTATDPATLLGATLVLVGTATFASWLPARQAARVDPAQALRAE